MIYCWPVKFWFAVNPKSVYTLKGHHGGVRAVAFHPHRPLLASASDDQTLILWNIEEILKLDPLFFACDWLQDYLRTNPTLPPDDAELCRGEG